MKKELFELFGKSSDLSLENIITRLAVATVIACFIFLSYRISHDGSIYSKKFNVSLAALTVITTTVMIVIGNNLAMSLGMVGALSIVRFRTAVKDSRDTVYIFWTIVAGICCGAGDYLTASAGSAFVFVLLLLFGRIRNDNRVLLIIRTARMNEERVEALIFQYFSRKATLRVKNTTETAACWRKNRGPGGRSPTRSTTWAMWSTSTSSCRTTISAVERPLKGLLDSFSCKEKE